MPHETSLLATVVVSLSFAFAGGLLAAQLKLPPLVGYLLAGMMVGPFTPGFVADARLAPQLAEIGVILLLFGVGMHFSLRDLWEVRVIAIAGALTQIALATALGAGLAWSWGWSLKACIVFGLALSVASTVVLLRVLEARGSLHLPEGRIAVGWLIVEDLITVLALLLLPALADSTDPQFQQTGLALAPASWSTLLFTIGKLVALGIVFVVVGLRFFPWLLKQAERTGTRELFTLAVIALSLGTAFAAAHLLGVSYALGAFFAGVMINGSEVSQRAAVDLRPLESAFGALFFVAVGMLFDPAILVREPLRALAVLGIVMVGKSLGALGIVLALKQPPRIALTVSAALAQIGEFSFILAELGVVLGLLPAEGQQLIVAGALLSITLNPLMFRLASRF